MEKTEQELDDEYHASMCAAEWESMVQAENAYRGFVEITGYDHEWEIAEKVAATLKH
tara:strand:- start:93 stop:263 length:171 start_codon:yes stop_codon:yes gene_type:complete